MNLYQKIILLFSLPVIIFSSLLLLYWLFYPYKVIEIKSPTRIVTPIVKAGGTLTYFVDYCKLLDVPALVTKQLVDRQVIFLPEVTTNAPKGCLSGNRDVELPRMLPPDTYHLHMTTTYHVNPLRDITYTWDSDEFLVVR